MKVWWDTADTVVSGLTQTHIGQTILGKVSGWPVPRWLHLIILSSYDRQLLSSWLQIVMVQVWTLKCCFKYLTRYYTIHL